MTGSTRDDPHDIRGRGFVRRATLGAAQLWIDRECRSPVPHPVPVVGVAGLRLAETITASRDAPESDRATRDGFAVASADTLGAGSYNSIPLPNAWPVAAGDPMPPGYDAVLPFEAAQAAGALVEAVDTVAPGAGVERRGAAFKAGAVLLEPGRRLRPADLALLAELGWTNPVVVPPPRVRIVLAGGPRHGAETLGAMLTALVRRDGGIPDLVGPLPADRKTLADAYSQPGADVILSAGRTSLGADDVAPLALTDCGTLAIHGVALRPGDSVALGIAPGGVPAILLPGEPMACLAAHELLGGCAVRRTAGRPAALPHRGFPALAARKLVSEIGCVDLHRVRRTADGRAEPVASPAVPGLASAARADGFVLIPAESEGVPEGAPVTIYLFDDLVL